MNICTIAFSTDWFLTIPGMLISCGVLLLIIALIMFVVSSSKGRKKKNKDMPVSMNDTTVPNVPTENTNPVVNSFVETPIPEVPVAPVVDFNNNTVAVNEPMGPITESVMPTNVIPEVEAQPVVSPIPEVTPVIANEPVQPVVEPVSPVVPEIIVPEVQADVIPTETIKPQPVETKVEDPVLGNVAVNANNVNMPSVNIYGGVAPVVPPVQEEVRPIYGGADPLDATQNLPKMDVHHEPYSGGKDVVTPIPAVTEIPVVEPVSAPVAPNPVVPEVVSTPVVDVQPQVVESPIPKVVEIPESAEVEQL